MKNLILLAIAAIAFWYVDKNYLHIFNKPAAAPAPEPTPEIKPAASPTGTPFVPRPQPMADTKPIIPNTGITARTR